MEKLREKIKEKLNEINVLLVNMSWYNQGKEKILQVEISKKDSPINLDVCEEATRVIDPIIDEFINDDDAYFLEVCSAGVEREITNAKDLSDVLGSYVLVRFKQPIKQVTEIKGNIELKGEKYYLEGFIKGVKKKLEFTYDDIEYIRLSVKL